MYLGSITLEKKKVMKDKEDIQGMTELQDTACRKKSLLLYQSRYSAEDLKVNW